MFALAPGHHSSILAHGDPDNEEGGGGYYAINALLLHDDNRNAFEREVSKLGSALVNECFPGVTDGITSRHIRAENFCALVTATTPLLPGRPCGQVLVACTPDGVALLRGLCVHRSHRRMGVGSLLLRAVRTLVLKPGVVIEVRVDVFDANVAALCGWYKRLGFAAAQPAEVGGELRFTLVN